MLTEENLPMLKIKKLTSHDLFSIKIIEDCKISPDGDFALFTVKSFVPEKNEYESHLEHLPLKKGECGSTPFTHGPRDSGPRFSPDGKYIAFLRKTGQDENLFIMPTTGGEAKQLTNFNNEISEVAWSPDGKLLTFSSFVTDKGFVPSNEKSEENLYKKYNADVKIINRIWYKLDGKGFLHDKRSQIFAVELQSGNIKQITSGDHDAFSPQFSPDGKWIAFASNRNPDPDYDLLSHIYVVPASGGVPRNLTPGEYYFTAPSFSPDGKWIAFVGTDEPKNWYFSPRLWVMPSQGGKPECLTLKPDRPVGDQSIGDLRSYEHGGEPALWDSTSKKIYFTLSDSGKVFPVSFSLKDKMIREYAKGNHVVHKWDKIAHSSQGVFVKSEPCVPNDLWSLDFITGETKRLTDINASFLKEFIFPQPETITAKSKDGTQVEGWILKPPDFQEEKKYPLVLEIHGGPMAMYSWSFFYEFQLLAHHGFVVAYSNPRGSMGYGQPFCEAINNDWGNLDYQDVMTFLDEVLAKRFTDEKRLGVAGGSYGGFMTNWVVGHTDRFKAAVTMRSVTSETSMFGTSDYGYISDYDHHGEVPWTNPGLYQKVSPLTYVANINTPLLILHSEDDLRCPIEQAEQLYTALKKLKQEVLFVRFPGESHDLSRTGKPWHRVFRYDQIVGWFERHLL